LSDIVGRLLIIKVANSNNATSVTIELDGLTPTVVKKYGSETLAIGNIQAGMICIFMYDGTNFQLLNPKYSPPQGSATYYYSESPSLTLPTDNNSLPWNHGFSPNKPTYVDAYIQCTTATAGYQIGDEINVLNLFSWIDAAGDLSAPPYIVSFDQDKVYIVAGPLETDNTFQVWNKSTGAQEFTSKNNWVLKFKATRIVPV
jgi:hypothetical protein